MTVPARQIYLVRHLHDCQYADEIGEDAIQGAPPRSRSRWTCADDIK